MPGITVTEIGVRDSCLGQVLQIKVWAPDFAALSWSQVWEVFTQSYPDRWAVQVFPPVRALVDGKNVYHLWVLDEEPEGLNLRAKT